MTPPLPTETTETPSSVHFEPPDILSWRVVGDVSEAEMLRLRAVARSLSMGRPYVLSLVDLSRIGTVSAGARKASIDPEPVAPLLGTAIFGASFTSRVIAQFVSTAGDLLLKPKGSPKDSSTHFLSSREHGSSSVARSPCARPGQRLRAARGRRRA